MLPSSLDDDDEDVDRSRSSESEERDARIETDEQLFSIPTAVPLVRGEDRGDVVESSKQRDDDDDDAHVVEAIVLNFLTVKVSPGGERYKIDLEEGADAFRRVALKELKRRIGEKTGVPPERQRLVYGGKMLQGEDTSLDAFGLSCGQCVILSPGAIGGTTASPSSSSSVADEEVDPRTLNAMWAHVLSLNDSDDRRRSDSYGDAEVVADAINGDIPYALLRLANAARLVAAILFFYYCISVTFTLALLFHDPDEMEDNVSEQKGELPDAYQVFANVMQPITSVGGLCVAYVGIKSVAKMNLKLARRYLAGCMVIGLFEVTISLDPQVDYDDDNAYVSIILNVAITALFWIFCTRVVYRFFLGLKQYASEQNDAVGSSGIAMATVVV